MRFLKLLLAFLWDPANRLCARFFLGGKREEFGKCVFSGSESFLAICREAMSRLAQIDPDFYSDITEQRPHVVYYTSEGSTISLASGLVVIDRHWCGWGSTGVIARLVEAHYVDRELGRSPKLILCSTRTAKMHLETIAKLTADWLSKHGWPSELVDYYRERERRACG